MDKQDPVYRKNAWSSYWASGALHSCASSYQGNYRGAISEFWEAISRQLDSGSRILDIATGNGALPLLFCHLRSDAAKVDTIDAVDMANVAPAWLSTQPKVQVQFHSGVRMEHLPFGDGCFDLVVSQYGIEYGQWPDALHESIRVCRNSGALAFVLHHSSSVLASVGREELANLDILMNSRGLLDAARYVIPWLAAVHGDTLSETGMASARICKTAYNDAMAVLAEKIESSEVPDLLLEARQRVHQIVSGTKAANADQALLQLAQYADALAGARLRSEEMISHALSSAQMQEMVGYLAKIRPDWEVTSKPIVQVEGVLGWKVIAGPAGSFRHARSI